MGEREILVVEDNSADVLWIQHVLAGEKQRPWKWQVAGDLQSALSQLEKHRFDLILLDLNLPDSRGLDTLNSVLKHSPKSPIVVRTAYEDEELAYKAIEVGAQDYLLKEVLDRSRFLRLLNFALLRQNQTSPSIRLSEEARLDLVGQAFEIYSEEDNSFKRHNLTPFEFRLLAFLAGRRSQVLNRQEILQQLRGPEFSHYTERTIDVHISTLKNKFPFLKNRIKSVYGVGYVLESEFQEPERI